MTWHQNNLMDLKYFDECCIVYSACTRSHARSTTVFFWKNSLGIGGNLGKSREREWGIWGKQDILAQGQSFMWGPRTLITPTPLTPPPPLPRKVFHALLTISKAENQKMEQQNRYSRTMVTVCTDWPYFAHSGADLIKFQLNSAKLWYFQKMLDNCLIWDTKNKHNSL